MNSNNYCVILSGLTPTLCAVTRLLQSILYPGILILLYTLQIKGISPPCPTQALSACQPTASPVCVSTCHDTHVNMCVCKMCAIDECSVFLNEWGHTSYLLAHTTSAQLTPFFKLFDALPLH